MLLGGVAAVAFVAAIVNFIGTTGFPYNAPVESIFAIGISIDLLAIAVACAIGAARAFGSPAPPASGAIPTIALVFAGLALLVWAMFGIYSIVQLVTERGRFMDATWGLFVTGGFWVTAAIFAAHSVRRGEGGRRRLFAVLTLVIVGLLAGYAVFSSLIYGMGLTD